MGLHLAKLTPTAREKRERSKSPMPPSPKSPMAEIRFVPEQFLLPEDVLDSMAVLTWNLSAVNNNPFEYWLSYDDPQYLELMQGVECFLDDPGDDDVAVVEVFTENMFQEIKEILSQEGMEGLDEVEALWRGGDMGLMQRRSISEFVHDGSFGAKRLISMPDRITNTINVVTRKETLYQPPPIYRPSVMNNFAGDLSAMDVWWEQWKRFMFQEQLTVRTKTGIAVLRPVEMLEPIPRSKYPALSAEEERLSIPLQILCLAIFDAITVHLMNALSPENTWQVVKSEICDRLYRNKNRRTVQILAEKYAAVDVLCLQEVAAVFKDAFQKSPVASSHEIIMPQKLDGKRDQNSVIVLSKGTFVQDSIKEVTSLVAGFMPDGQKLSDGDLIAVEALGANDHQLYLIVSFHGDTNGLMTLPVVNAVDRAMREQFIGHTCIFGLDANTHANEQEGKLGFAECIEHLVALGLSTCWGDRPEAAACITTCSARTSLQPQLNKAVRYRSRIRNSSMDPKDHILFYRNQLELIADEEMGAGRQPNPVKDNTGRLVYREKTVFPTMDFPSDHGIVAVALRKVAE